MTTAHLLSVVLIVLAGSLAEAGAQTLPWPGDPAPGQRPAATPAPSARQGPPAGFGQPAGGPPPACITKFTELRTEVEKRGMAAKAGQEKKVTREEMCQLIKKFAAAEGKWVKYAVDNVSNCGIPQQAIQQIKASHSRTLIAEKNVCAAGPAAAPATPSLSDALGTSRLPVPDTTNSGRGTFDTLTGNVIAR